MGHCWSSSPQPHSHSRFMGFSEPRADSCQLHITHSALRGPAPYTWTFHRRVFCSHARRGTLERWKLLLSSRWERRRKGSTLRSPHWSLVWKFCHSPSLPLDSAWRVCGGGWGEECSLGALTRNHSPASQALRLPAQPDASWLRGVGTDRLHMAPYLLISSWVLSVLL